jgi:hypothetical protein
MRSKLIAGVSLVVVVGGATVFLAHPAQGAVALPGGGSWGQPVNDHVRAQCAVSLPGGKTIVVPDAQSNEDCIQKSHICLYGRTFMEIKWKDVPMVVPIQADSELCTEDQIAKLRQAD